MRKDEAIILHFLSVKRHLFRNLFSQISVDAAVTAVGLILQTILYRPADLSEQTERAECRRVVTVGFNTVEKLCGILIAVSGRGLEVLHCFLVDPFHLFAVETNLTELVFGKVISVLGGNFKVADCFCDIFNAVLGEP